jgi:hypothetical protein
MVPRAGLEPATLGLEVLCSIHLSYQGRHPTFAAYNAGQLIIMVRVRRVELRSPVWKTGIITDIRHPHIYTCKLQHGQYIRYTRAGVDMARLR